MIKKYTLKFSKDYNSRNQKERDHKYFTSEPLARKIISIVKNYNHKIKALEIGCGNGDRIKYLKNLKLKNLNISGVDPASDSVFSKKGATYNLPFKNNTFDLVYYAFCLYMVKPEDLINSLYECNRVTKKKSWIIIYDFYSKNFVKKKYKHFNTQITKMDYTKMFSWIPGYLIKNQVFFDYENNFKFTKDKEKLSTLITIKKNELNLNIKK
jgi:ubiquinone/menaquinone biosynthesis C-methylase UbiE